MIREIPVYFSSCMLAPAQGGSPSAAKPAPVVEAWRQLGVPIDIRAPHPVSPETFHSVHDRGYVDAVLACERENGFGTRSREVAASLPYTCGAMVDAATEAMQNGFVAVAPCSGFHHARWHGGGGYCTFNGLMVAALEARHGGARRVGILDFDQHWGDGTHDIIRCLDAESWVVHYHPREYGTAATAERFLREITLLMKRFQDCDLILYQAGADPHIEDPLGGWLTTDQLRRRDRAVFEAVKTMRIPIAWNLAGGYQDPLSRVIEIHENTMAECWRVFRL